MSRLDTAPTVVKTTCPYCGVGCGVLATLEADGTVEVRGDPNHPANFGRLCSKGAALGETVGLDDRLLYPEIQGHRATWEEALDHLAQSFLRVIREHGPDAVAFYVSGQLLTEEYYVANKLMKGYIGSGNIDTNSRLCMSSAVAGHQRAFGEDVVPGCYEDLDLADLIVLVGSNTAWCHPVLFQRIVQAKKERPKLKIVSIDPRRTATDVAVDLHLALKPGSDVALFNGLLNFLRHHDKLDFAFLDDHLQGYGETLAMVRETAPSIPAVAAACGLVEEDVATFYRWFARTEKVVTAWCQGVNQSSSGTDKVNAILNVHLATGRIGRPGTGPFSLTGQPNAMGGREVSGFANALAAHMGIENAVHRQLVQEFWHSPVIAQKPGLKAVDLFQAVGEGRIKALWIMATNPAVSLPDVNGVCEALRRCEFVAVSDCADQPDLRPYAHVRLPALAWGEKDGTVTNSERRISRQRAFLPVPGEAKPDWWIITRAARSMGYGAGFPYESPQAIFVEHARLSGHRNPGERIFDISGLAGLDRAAYDALQPIQWPVNSAHPEGAARLFADGGFPFDNRRARLLPLLPRAPANAPDERFPLVLNSGRIRDQWHTMTRTAKTPRLVSHLPEPYAEINPQDAVRLDLEDGALVRLESRYGNALARARISRHQRLGSVFMPMHWTAQYAKHGLVNALVNPVTDPVSGEPESKHTPVRVEPYTPAWHAFVLSRQTQTFGDATYEVTVRGEGHWLYELAGESPPGSWPDWAHATLAGLKPDDEWLEFADPYAGLYRCAQLRQNRLQCCLFVNSGFELPGRNWLSGLFALDALSDRARLSLLAGKPASQEDDHGRIVCSCFSVGINTLLKAIREHRLTTPEEIGALLKAGQNCGSCVPELRILLQERRSS